MPGFNNENNHSEEAQEILGRIPSWTIRWGVTVIFLIFSVIIIGCCLIKFPQRVNATVTITTGNAPVDVVPKGSGDIEKIFVRNNDTVCRNALLAVIYSSADYKDVLAVEDSLAAFSDESPESAVFHDWIYGRFAMGDMQSEWSAFSTACRKYKDYIQRAVIARKKELIAEQVGKQREYYLQMSLQETLMKEDLEYEMLNYRRDSSLFADGIIASLEFEEASRKVLQARNNLVSFQSQMTSAELSIIQLEQQSVELSIQEDDDILGYEQEIAGCLERMKAQIDSWKLSYLLTSPMDGHVSFVRKWDEGQFIGAGESFLTVVPADSSMAVGIVNIPQASFGKVAVGQKVNVCLNGYPYMEYGMLVGEIGYLSSVPDEASGSQAEPQYTAEIVFPDGFITTYGKELRLIQKMDGTAEIITEDRRLIMRFIEPIVALFRNGI